MALLYKNQGRHAEAISLCEKALRVWEKSLGPYDPDVATVLENMAQLYTELGDKEQAIRLEERARAIRGQH